MYPNSVSTALTVELDKALVNGSYNVYDAFGKRVVNGKINGNQVSIPASEMTEGIYVININHSGAKKFIVQH